MTLKQWIVFPALAVAVGAVMVPAYAASRCSPSARFVVVEGGLVRDTLTRLVWQRQASTTTMTYPNAQTFCSSNGFRVPTVKELFSLVDRRASPTLSIDPTAFPGTPANAFWTSTGYQPSPTDAMWIVSFYNGESGSQQKTTPNYVRCVR